MKEGERFRRAFEDAAIGIALLAVEPLGKYLEVNPTFCRMTGYSRKELLTRNFQSITASQDVGSNIEQMQVLLQGSILFIKLEKRYLRKDGSAFWARLNVSLVRDDRNRPLYFIVQIEDIDERKRTEEQLRRSKALLTEAQQVGRIGNWNWDIPTNVITWSDQMYRIFGIAPQEGPMPYETFLNYVHPEDREDVKRITQKALQDHQPFDHDRRIVWPDGTIHVYHSRGVVELDAAGKPIRLYGTAQDITERKRMEEALFENRALLNSIIDSTPSYIFAMDLQHRFSLVNDAVTRLLGISKEEILGKTEHDVFPKDLADVLRAANDRIYSTGEPLQIEEVVSSKARGHPRVVITIKFPLRNTNGNICGLGGVATDITERKRTEEALRDSGQLNEQIIRSAREGIVVHDRDLRYRAWNPYIEEMTGLKAEMVLGKHPLEVIPIQQEHGKHILTETHVKEILDGLKRAMAGETVVRPDFAVTLKQSGQMTWNSVRYDPLRNTQGDIVGVIVTIRDITERKRAEEALRESSQFNQQVIDNAREGIIVYDREIRYVVWNPFMEELSGLRAEKVLGKRPRDLLTIYKEEQGKLQMDKETVENIEASVKRAMAGETFSYLDIPFLIRQTGMMGWTSVRYGPFRNAQGEIVGVIATVRDVTEQKRLEEQLRHAQKLEAVGQLAGGVAHEFNNMLTAIIGNLDLAIGEIPPGSDQRSTLTAALQAARRAALLTQQLLTLSHRGPMDLQPQHLGAIAKDVVDFLRQTIDRRIQVHVQTPESLWAVLADALQMHQVIMNLCVNARDSLVESLEGTAPEPVPPGWEPRIVIAADNVRIDEAYCKLHFDARPGEYVCLSVSDNGYGIAEGISHRIFEPFFTTKEVGRGTGLGLATVYGIIKQHEAWIDLSSTKYGETAFKLFLPRTDRPAVPTSPSAATSPGTARGTETILFVDDEAPIRRLGQTILEHHGYTVLLAKDGEEALEVFNREHERIKLVVLDLTMPRLSGREVLKRLLLLDARIRVLISSGHHAPTDSTELQNLGMVKLVPKPYRPDDLARSVRKLLDAPVSPSPTP